MRPSQSSLLDLDVTRPDTWGALRAIGLDGMSQRLRFMLGKAISKDAWVTFLCSLVTLKTQQLKVYMITGLPSESDVDWLEFVDSIRDADSRCVAMHPQYGLIVTFTHFRAMPATPAAGWPMSIRMEMERPVTRLQRLGGTPHHAMLFFRGKALFAGSRVTPESLALLLLDLLVLRCTETHAQAIRHLALSTRFWSANAYAKERTIRDIFDVEGLGRKYDYDELPTRYLRSYVTSSRMDTISRNYLTKFGV